MIAEPIKYFATFFTILVVSVVHFGMHFSCQCGLTVAAIVVNVIFFLLTMFSLGMLGLMEPGFIPKVLSGFEAVRHKGIPVRPEL